MEKRVTRRGASRFAALFRNNQPDKFSYTELEHRGWAVVVCVLLSILLWFFFSMRRTTSLDLTLPTRIVNLPPGESLATAPPSSVTFRVRGDGLSLLPLYYNRPYVEIDAAMVEVNFETNANDFPADLRIESAVPSAYYPLLEPSRTVTVPIRLDAEIATASTHEFVRYPTVIPDSVSITGARSIVSRLSSWPTVPLRLSNFRDSLYMELPLSDSLSGLVELSRNTTIVRAVAEAFTQGTRKIEARITGAPYMRKIATLDPAIVTVTYRVRVSDYNRTQITNDFFATVAYDQIRGDTTGRVVPELNLPRGLVIRDVEMSPPSLRYFNYLE